MLIPSKRGGFRENSGRKPEQDPRILALYGKGHGWMCIARQLGCSERTARNAIARAGFAVRSPRCDCGAQ